MVDTKINICGLTLKNPIMTASGTFGYGKEFSELYDLNVLGGISVKGTTLEPRFGNSTPRIAECPAGLLNAVGLQNPGIDKALAEELPRLRKIFKGAIILNIGGFSPEEFGIIAEKADQSPFVDIIEVNVSCPNLHEGGKNFGVSAEGVAAVTKAVRRATSKPVFVKLTPNVTDITETSRAAEDSGADGLTLINTLLGMRINIKCGKPVLANLTGGYSGAGIFPIAVRAIYQAARAVKIPIIGVGGAARPEDVIEMLYAGASAVQIGSANLTDPYASKTAAENLPSVMEKYGITRLTDIIGAAHNG